MGSPLVLTDVKQVSQLAEVIWRQEANAISNIQFPSEQERSKYLRDCLDNYTTVQELLNQGVELKEKNQNDAVRSPITNDIFLYIIYCCNSALQTVPNYTVRKDYLSKISDHVKSLIEELVNLDTGNPDDVSTLKEEAAEYKECMLELVKNYRSSASAQFSRWVNQQGLTFDQLVQKYQSISGLDGLFKNLKEVDKIRVYDDIIKASGREGVVKSLTKLKSVGGLLVLVVTAGLTVWDIFSSDHKIQTATHDAVVTIAGTAGAVLGDIIGAAIATNLIGVEATSMFVAMVGFATGLLGAFILGAIAGSLVEAIIGSGGTTNISTTEGHKFYVAPMPDGVVLARQIAHN